MIFFSTKQLHLLIVLCTFSGFAEMGLN